MIKNILKLFFLKVRAFFKLIIFFLSEFKKIKNAEVVFFFPFYHTGGAEKVHLNIVKVIGNSNNYVFFSNKSESDNFKKKFDDVVNTYEIFEFLNRNFLIKKTFIKLLVMQLNRSRNLLTVFGSNSILFYELLPLLSESIKKIDLVHAFSKPDYGIELFSLPYVTYLNTRVVINHNTFENFEELYLKNNISNFLDRITIINNGLSDLNVMFSEKKPNNFSVLFVGRWSKEKRPEFFIEICKKIKLIYPNINFTMVGTKLNLNNEMILNAGINNEGEIFDDEILNSIYQRSNIVLITSYREGFPLVIMEAMSNGVVPISVDIGGISEHIQNNYNGYLIDNHKSNEFIIDCFVEKIIQLYQNQNQLRVMSKNAFLYSQNQFGTQKFNLKYREIILR